MTEELVFCQLGLPAFQNKVYSRREAARNALRGDVELVQCRATGLVFNRQFILEVLKYDADYQNEQAYSPAFKHHLDEVLTLISRNFDLNGFGVEIGCDKGYLFELLRAQSANVYGYDPAYEGSNTRIKKEYYMGDNIANPPDYIILRHVLEHIPSSWQFLEQLAADCHPGTQIYIEVPCFEWIVFNNAFYDIFYEHVNYFTLDVLSGAFSVVAESGIFFGGQYLYIIADLASYHVPQYYTGRQFAGINPRAYLVSLLERRRANPSKAYIWGAGAKGTTFANILILDNIHASTLWR